MKIPETSANVGAYYGNEQNGQWQPNGMIMDTGIGGGIVGSGDAGIHRPPVYPVHIPRGHMPGGYVMAGAYFPPAGYQPVPPPAPDDFADYMWMENEEEFDKQVMQQLEEEALMEQCIEAMLEDERTQNRPIANGHKHSGPTTSNGAPSLSLEETVSRSTLNPLAAEFVPTGVRLPPPPPQPTERRTEPETAPQPSRELVEETTEVRVTEEPRPDLTEEPTMEETSPPHNDPPEVSAADETPADKQDKETPEKRPKDKKVEPAKKTEAKRPAKVVEMKKKSPPAQTQQAVKSDTKLQPKKKEVKAVKSEAKVVKTDVKVVKSDVKVEEKTEVEKQVAESTESVKSSPPPPKEESPEPISGIKPINYAAAAKANKPKKPTSPPATENKTPPTLKPEKKDKGKSEKPIVQRKNSTK